MTLRNSIKNKDKQQDEQEGNSYLGQIFSSLLQAKQHILKTPESQHDFYEQYKRVLGISCEIQKQIRNQKSIQQELVQKIENLEKNMENFSNLKTGALLQSRQYIKKRSRRMAEQIQRKYKCEVQFCQKQYGSEGSLIQHIKLKHPQLHDAEN